MKVQIINGPNLNLTGIRQQEIYGSTTFEHFFAELQSKYFDIDLQYFQSNHEGEIIDKIHDIGFVFDGLIINAGAYSHSSPAIGDALASVKCMAIEVHLSNIFKRESFRHHSFLTANCKGLIAGLGLEGYQLALDYLIMLCQED
jgi:3-dehydroquinate dehydratase II